MDLPSLPPWYTNPIEEKDIVQAANSQDFAAVHKVYCELPDVISRVESGILYSHTITFPHYFRLSSTILVLLSRFTKLSTTTPINFGIH